MYAKKSLGQHFLTNPTVVDTLVDAARIEPGTDVLEIGPGTGVLTRGLLAAGARVTAIEADARAIEVLEETFHDEVEAGQLMLLHDDIRTFDVAGLGFTDGKYTVAANIPYYITGFLLTKLLGGSAKPAVLVFLMQKEVAERIARHKKASLLSLSVRAYGTPRYIRTVTKGNFSPPPKVDSAILQIADISCATFSRISEADFFRILKVGFHARRKQLIGNLTALAPRDALTTIFAELGIPPDARGEDLNVATWAALAEALVSHTK